MLDVYFTVDVEVWCDGWVDIDKRFADAFKHYVYGPTSWGHYGLPHTLSTLDAYGLKGVFFVEPLFSLRFGRDPLAEIVGLVNERRHEVQLHLHPEWVDESPNPLIHATAGKIRFLSDLSLEEQTTLIDAGLDLLKEAGGGEVNAFRAGSFGSNANTLRALNHGPIKFDSSYNASSFGRNSGIAPGTVLTEPIQIGGVFEYPLTVFNDGTHRLRPVQLTACSYPELEGLLWQALERGRKAFVILSHNFELLNRAKTKPDRVVVDRLERLCKFLDRNRDCFNVRGFTDSLGTSLSSQPPPLSSPMWRTGLRIVEQVFRRKYG